MQSYLGMKFKLKQDDYKPGKVKVYTKAEIKAFNKQLAADAKSAK